ncbi:MAG: hypothetical protein AAF942_00080 [Pseudomonadota bacterium]
MKQKRINLGTFSVGEIPEPLQVTFLTDQGVAIDLTGFAVDFVIESINAEVPTDTVLGAGSASIVNPATGGVTQYAWDAQDFQNAGYYEGQMWAGNGTNRYASRQLFWNVADITAAPSI